MMPITTHRPLNLRPESTGLRKAAPRPARSFHPSPFHSSLVTLHSFLLPLLLLLSATLSSAAPDFVLSGRASELQGLVLAQDEAGLVTALDVLFYLDMARNPAVSTPVEAWLAKPAERDPAAWSVIAPATDELLAVRSIARKGAPPSTSAEVRRSLLHSAAAAVWIENVVQPQIKIEPTDVNRYYIAHPEKYAAKSRATVRYIFFPVEDMSQLSLQREAENELGALRDRIANGEIAFDEAARQFSKAPSAKDGGLIPEFSEDQHFAEFNFQAFSLKKPGAMSPVFIGNDGAYLIRLEGVTEPRKAPISEVRPSIVETLEREHAASYFRFMAVKLRDDGYFRDLSAFWPYLDLRSPIVVFGERQLSRDHLLRMNPAIINSSYEVQLSVLQSEKEAWVEGEAILTDLEKRGLMGHPYMSQAEGVAGAMLTARAWLASHVDRAKAATPEAAARTLGLEAGEGETAGVLESRLIQFAIHMDEEAKRDAGRAAVARQTIRKLAKVLSTGNLPTRPEPEAFGPGLTREATRSAKALDKEIERLRSVVAYSPWTGAEIKISDLGWKTASPVMAWHPSLAGLKTGEITAPQMVGDDAYFYFIAGTRVNPENPWKDVPLVLQTMAFDYEMANALRAENALVQEMNLLKFERP